VKKLNTVRGRGNKIFNEHKLTIGFRKAMSAPSKKAMARVFGSMGRCRIGMEVGTHSPWVSRATTAFWMKQAR
jgi:hypothetical protein